MRTVGDTHRRRSDRDGTNPPVHRWEGEGETGSIEQTMDDYSAHFVSFVFTDSVAFHTRSKLLPGSCSDLYDQKLGRVFC